MFVVVLFVLTIFGAQLVRVQAFDASRVQEAALSKRLATVTIQPMRGRILDSKGVVLASSVERRTVTVDQTAVREYARTIDGKRVTVGVVGAAQRLAPLLGTTPEALVPELIGTSQYRIIAKNVTPLVWRDIKAMGIPGIYSEVTFERNYPASIAAAPLVGFLTNDGAPGGGLEQMMQGTLAGQVGKEVYEQARDGKPIPWAERQNVPAQDGRDVVTTIDADLQWYAQNQIAAQVAKTGALSGYVVVMEAKTGKLRAVASYPTFDPAELTKATPSTLRNAAFEDVYEPGSTGKVMSIAAALEEHVISPTTGVVVPNRIKRGGTSFKDHNEHPTLDLTVAGVLAKSSNIGTILATESVPASTMESYFRAFGMGGNTGLGFPGESAGLVTSTDQLSGSQRYTMLFGQGYSLTALQAAGVYQTIANKGVRVAPSLIEGTMGADGALVPASQPQGQRVVSESTAQQVSDMLEEVVGPGGTAPQAKVPGYRVAGKTGTANRYEDSVGRYAGYTTSFIGYAPAEDPTFVVAVTLQRPQVAEPTGSGLAGPVFKDVMTYALQSYAIPPTGSDGPAIPLVSQSRLDPADPAVVSDRKPTG